MSDFLETSVDKFIFRVATDRLYSRDGIWVLEEEGGKRVRLGVTDYEQQRSGDVAFVHLRDAGTPVAVNSEFAEVETIKATVSLPSPVAGSIVDSNGALALTPEVVNQEPYGKGWLVVLETRDWASDRAKLLDAATYLAVMRSQAEEELGKS
jgi:glycine cleavage system H protein